MILYVICGVSIIYFGMTETYDKCFQAGLIIFVLLLFRGLITWTKSELSPALRFSVLIFITITMMLANLFNMYAVIPYLDKIEHLLSGAWEIYEFVVDHLFGLHSQNASLTDTMLDIICGTVGAVVSSIYLLYKARVVTNNPVA